MNQYLKSFLIGSSPFLFIPFYAAVTLIPESNINLQIYPLEASLYFGCMNMLSVYLGEKYNLNLDQRLKLITVISVLTIWMVLLIFKPYNFKSQNRWICQGMLVAMGHTVAYMVVIRTLEIALKNKS